MNKNKGITIYSELYMYYKKLFTKKQCLYLEDYFLHDLSFQEVAKKYHVSSMAIADSVKRCKKLLDEYENKLGLYRKSIQREKLIAQIKEAHIQKKLIELEKI